MCNLACLDFGTKLLCNDEIRGKRVLEVGSHDVNGSLRQWVQERGPASYFGVDISVGRGVDEVCNAEDLTERFGAESFDLVISTEMLEHVRDWRKVIENMKKVLKPHGIILLTTRSKGKAYHGYPHDFWRYEVEDMHKIFDDFTVVAIESDPTAPGVFVKATKPIGWVQADLRDVKLYSIVTNKYQRRLHLTEWLVFRWKMRMRKARMNARPLVLSAWRALLRRLIKATFLL